MVLSGTICQAKSFPSGSNALLSTRSSELKAQPQKRTSRGRPRSSEREERQHAVLDAAFEELLESGYEGVTMLRIAQRAGASKETLYAWFGNREGLFAALITRNGDQVAQGVEKALAGRGSAKNTLTGFCNSLLTLLTSSQALALNRAAMNSPELANLLLVSGRLRVGPIVEQYLQRLQSEGLLRVHDPVESFSALYGLVVRDSQIRALLGESALSSVEISHRAKAAVVDFFRLYGE